MKNEEKCFFTESIKPRESVVYHSLVVKGAKTYEIQATDGTLYLAVLGEENSTGSFVRSSKVVNGKYYVSVTSNPRVIEELITRLDRIFPTSKSTHAAGISVIILSQYNGAINYAEWRSKGV